MAANIIPNKGLDVFSKSVLFPAPSGSGLVGGKRRPNRGGPLQIGGGTACAGIEMFSTTRLTKKLKTLLSGQGGDPRHMFGIQQTGAIANASVPNMVLMQQCLA